MSEDDISSLLVPLTPNQRVISTASGKVGQHVQFSRKSPGGCEDFVGWALDKAGAKVPTRRDPDVWGTEIRIADVTPGDILQIAKPYVVNLKQVVEYTVRREKRSIVHSYHEKLHHHTAIVQYMMDKIGFIPTLEQMLVGSGKLAAWKVREFGFYTRNVSAFVTTTYDRYFVMRVEHKAKGEVTSTLTVTVKGAEDILAYRPIPGT